MMRTHVVHPSNVSIVDFIAMGGYGKVFRGVYHPPQPETPDEEPEEGVDVAIKVIDDYFNEKNSRRMRVGREIDILDKLQGNAEFIELIQVYRGPGVVEENTPEALYIIMPFVPMTCYRVARDVKLRNAPGYVDMLVKLIMAQTLSGLEKMHKAKLYHRDLSSSNILVDTENNFAYISDFGLSRSIRGQEDLLTPLVVTLPYRALELLLGPKATGYDAAKLDLWSAGMILWELLCGGPIQGSDEIKQAIAITKTLFGLNGNTGLDFGYWKTYNNGETKGAADFMEKNQSKLTASPLPSEVTNAPSKCQDVLFRLLSQRPEDRGTAAEILQMPWFTEDEYVPEALKELRSSGIEMSSDANFDRDVEPTPEFFDNIAKRLQPDETKYTTICHTQSQKVDAPLTQI